MDSVEELRLAKDILQAFPRARRILRTYPDNNPVYVKAVNDVFSRFKEFFELSDELTLTINRSEILLDSAEAFRSEGAELDLAFLFFRDGIRELRFRRDLSESELEEFLKIIAADLSLDDPDDDLVTLFWEKDFDNIRYFVDESFLMEEGDYEADAIERVKTKMPGVEQVLKTYSNTLQYVDVDAIPLAEIGEDDLVALLADVERSRTTDHVSKLAGMLLDRVRYDKDEINQDEIRSFFRDLLVFPLRHGDFKAFIDIGTMIRRAGHEQDGSEALRSACAGFLELFCTSEIVEQVAKVLDTLKDLGQDSLSEYLSFLSSDAIQPLVAALGDLETIQGRKRLIAVLSSLGQTHLDAFVPGLRDPRWYVVRNVVHILRHMADPDAQKHFIQALRHPEPRVRREAIRALGELKGPSSLAVLKDSLNDKDSANRGHAARALSDVGSEAAKKILLHEIGGRDFEERSFDERKEFFHALSRWKDRDVLEAMTRIIRERSFIRKGRVEENKALAAYALGSMGQREALPILRELRGSANRMLREYAENAIRAIEHGS